MIKKQLVRLDREPFFAGENIGKMCSEVLHKRIKSIKAVQKKRNIKDKILSSRARDFSKIIRKLAPHWLEEAAGMAKGAGVCAEDILIMNSLPPDFYPPTGNNCTSFINIGNEKNMLFKIRDERNHVQQFLIYGGKNDLNIQAGRDIGNLGIAHAFNSKAIAFANNTGSKTKLVRDKVAMNDCHILRYLAENVTGSVEEAPAKFELLADMGAAGGAGFERGCIFLLVDREKSLIMETAAENCSISFHDVGTRVVSNHFVSDKAKKWETKAPAKNTLLRKKRMEELLSGNEGEHSIDNIFAMSRDRKHLPHALCNDDGRHFWMTISAQLQVIDRRSPENSCNYICCGNTRNSVYLPFSIKSSETYVSLVSGDFYLRSDSLYRKYGCRGALKKMQKKFEKQLVGNCWNMDIYAEAFRALKYFEI